VTRHEEIMPVGTLIVALALLLGGAAWPEQARADEGKSLVLAPAPRAAGSPGECDRDCLYAFVDNYFDAMLSRCPCNLALAPDVRYAENEQAVKPGEGLWKTFSGRGTYRIYLADPETGQAGYYGDFHEDGGLLTGAIALRMKVKDHRITELEVFTVREEKRPQGGLGMNTAGVMTPRLIDELDGSKFIVPDAALLEPIVSAQTREQLIGAANGYFEAFAHDKSSLASFDTQCSRRENGMSETNNANGPAIDPEQPEFHLFSGGCAQEIDRGFFGELWKPRDVRALVVDRRQGLVLDLAFFDNEGDVKSVAVSGGGHVQVPAELLRPITFLAPELFKIEGGKIREIEGLSWPVPFGMKPGAWNH
jgi:hypothetical protein